MLQPRLAFTAVQWSTGIGLVIVGAISSGCHKAPPAPADSAKPSAAYVIDLEDASLPDVLTAYRKATGADLGMHAYVEHQTACVKLTLHIAASTVSDVDEVLAKSLGEKGLRIGGRPGARAVTRDRVLPPPCPDLEPDRSRGSSDAGPALDRGELVSRIKIVSPDHVEIEQMAADRFFGDPAEIVREIRAVPTTKDGKSQGVKIFGVKAGSIIGAMGFENGDLVRSINGFEMSSPEAALELYSKLRSTKKLVVVVDRGSASHEITIDVVGDRPRSLTTP